MSSLSILSAAVSAASEYSVYALHISCKYTSGDFLRLQRGRSPSRRAQSEGLRDQSTRFRAAVTMRIDLRSGGTLQYTTSVLRGAGENRNIAGRQIKPKPSNKLSGQLPIPRHDETTILSLAPRHVAKIRVDQKRNVTADRQIDRISWVSHAHIDVLAFENKPMETLAGAGSGDSAEIEANDDPLVRQ